jgi:hypothetical protein
MDPEVTLDHVGTEAHAYSSDVRSHRYGSPHGYCSATRSDGREAWVVTVVRLDHIGR